MEERVNEKIKEIEQYISELKTIFPANFKEYETNIEKKAACERYFDKIMEAVTDLAFLIIKNRNISSPEDDLNSFIKLYESGIVSQELAYKLREAKQMRNFIAHRYTFVDDITVFNSIKGELFSDVESFLDVVFKICEEKERKGEEE